MKKRELKALETERPPATVELEQISDVSRLKYVFTAKTHPLGRERILAATFFSFESREAEFRVFFDKKTFITERLAPKRKWSESSLDHLVSFWHGDSAAVCADEHSARRVRTFFKAGDETSPYSAMLDFQRDLRAKRLIAGFCTSCGGEVALAITKENRQEHVRHNGRGQCPLCRKTVTFKAAGKTTLQVDTVNAALMQKTAAGFAIRYFKVTKEYKDHYRQPKLHISELVRDFYDGRDIVSYEYGNFKQTGEIRWRKSLGVFHLDVACLYHRNVTKVLADTELRYCCLRELAKNVDQFNIYAYLDAYLAHPAYEYLVKLRLFRLVADNISYGARNNAQLNFAGRNYQEVLGLDRAGLWQMQRLDGTLAQYRLIKAACGVGVALKDGQAETLARMGMDHTRLAELLRFVTPGKAIGYTNQCLEKWERGESAVPYTLRSAASGAAGFWSDYLTNCALLGYDMRSDFILFPRDLKARHDEVMALVRTNRAELLDQAIAELNEALQSRYSFVWKRLFVRAPLSAGEITAEGHRLRHCVGAGVYIENMAKGKSCILFIRRAEKPDDPFFTLELRDGMVIQCRGIGNCDMTDEVKKFVAEFQRKKLRVKEARRVEI